MDGRGDSRLRSATDRCLTLSVCTICSLICQGIAKATRSVADAWILKSTAAASSISIPAHDSVLHFAFVLDGEAALHYGPDEHALQAGGSFLIPPGQTWSLSHCSAGLSILEVVLLHC
jgi:hypothetical protein